MLPRKQLTKAQPVKRQQLAPHTLLRIIIVTQLLVGHNPLLQLIDASGPDEVYL